MCNGLAVPRVWVGVAVVCALAVCGAGAAERGERAGPALRTAEGPRLDATNERLRLRSGMPANPSELLYGRAPRVTRAAVEAEDCDTCGAPAGLKPANARVIGTPVRPWNSEAGRRVTEAQLSLGALGRGGAIRGLGSPTMLYDYKWQDGFICTEPAVTVAGSGCCAYWITDQAAGKNVLYQQPYLAFGGPDAKVAEQKCRDFEATIEASLPLFTPYHDASVAPTSGWLYGPGRFHGAIDYCKSSYAAGQDPTFGVHAMGAGKVVSALWDNWNGNTVVIEHTAADGSRFRIACMHLRDGFTHDLAKARAITIPPGADKDDKGKPTNWLKYKRFADKTSPSQLLWGTDSQKIAVKPGDQVYAGQFIAWSGNTGARGAGNGLADDGTPNDPVAANNHLHLMVTVPNPAPGAADWIQVDPYGVYSDASAGCYGQLADTAYTRLIAPFYPSFHNVPIAVLSKYFGYYPGMGYGLQTLSLHRHGGDVLASGAFAPGLPPAWYARFYMAGADYQHWFDEYDKQGFRPRQVAVTLDTDGQPRFTVIWCKRGNEAYYTWHGLTDAEWQQEWADLVDKQHFRVEDHAEYSVGGTNRHAVVFVKDGDTAFYEFHHMDSPAFQAKFDELSGQGFRLVSVNVAELPAGLRFGGVWRKLPGDWVAAHGMTPEVYQQRFDDLDKQGYRLWRIQGYADSSRVAALWHK
ncbi:MAG: hypothetical protein HYU66_10810 [Armatimonadetes bacterium]|nr:hypothetical protein [Armatimonadota bacterium]